MQAVQSTDPKVYIFYFKKFRKESCQNIEHFTNLASNGPISIDFPKTLFHIFYIQADKAEIPKSFEL